MPARDSVIVDTHVVLWWQAGSDRMSTSALAALERADRILVSPITCWEIAMLVDHRRVALDRPVAAWVADLLAQDRMTVAPLTPVIAVAAGQFTNFHGDPADRMIYATAIANSAPLVTKDRRLRDYADRVADVTAVW